MYHHATLASINATQQIQEALNGREISLLVYNAALSYIGPFIKNSCRESLSGSSGKYDNSSEHGPFVWRKNAQQKGKELLF